jgi:hypothetical protein
VDLTSLFVALDGKDVREPGEGEGGGRGGAGVRESAEQHLQFVLVALAFFIVVKQINRLKRTKRPKE